MFVKLENNCDEFINSEICYSQIEQHVKIKSNIFQKYINHKFRDTKQIFVEGAIRNIQLQFLSISQELYDGHLTSSLVRK